MAEFANIKKEECIKKALPNDIKLGSSRTVVLQSVINAIKEHGRSSMHKEVCGVLVGNLCWDKEAYLLIDARIEGKHADHQAGSVTFTSETWDYIHAELAAKYPEKKIVGWYHTHPGFGIFLSNMDFFIHENFFSLPWQPAYVFDPQAETEGFFFWNDKELKQEKVTVRPDEKEIKREVRQQTPGKKIRIAVHDNGTPKQRQLKSILIGLLILINVLAIWLLYRTIQDLRVKWQSDVQELKNENTSHKKEFDRLRTQNLQ
ncbi:MAG: Mov34/MPN/PAD-1 family protein, partial [Victivallales bacterium]|nr:Mov34/MPN/PAD-1 family protein [Victivallales bacterium]